MARTNLKTGSPKHPEDSFDLLEFWRTLQRRWRFIFAFTAILFLLAAVYCLVATRKYSASGEIQVRKAAPDSLGLNSALGIQSSGEDSLLVNIDLQTQMNLLQSNSLALQVIDELHLETKPEFQGHFSLNPIGPLMRMITPKGHPDANSAPLVDRPNRRESVLGIFSSSLKVEPVPGTRLINISYLSEDPRTATDVVNRLMQDLISLSSKSQEATDSGSSRWVDGQLSAIRKEGERLQKEVARMQQQAGIVSLGTTDTAGHQQTYSAVLDQLQQTSATLGAAQTNRILKGAIYEAVKSGNPELISGISPNLTTAASPGVSTSLNLIQNLRVEEAAEQANLAQMEAKFGTGYPKLEETRMRIARFEQEIHDETDRIRERAKNDYAIAVQAERSTRDAYNKEKRQADAVNNSAMSLAIASEEAESSRKLYQDLFSRSKESEILGGLKSSGISVIDPALLPGKPAKPRVLIYLLASLFLGLSLGAGSMILFELLNGRIYSVEAIKGEFGRGSVALLPLLSPQEIATIEEPEANLVPVPGLSIYKLPSSSYSESLRSLGFSLLSSPAVGGSRVIMVTSPVEGEGKTTVGANLAVLFAQQGNRVLFVDTDFRHPRVHDVFGIDNVTGLSTTLAVAGKNVLSEIRAVPAQDGLFLLAAGTGSSHPSELLGLPRFGELIAECCKNFDIVLLDSAPVLAFSDSILVAKYASQVLLVSRMGQTRVQALRDSIARLEEHVAVDSIKLVVNGVDRYSQGSHAYLGGQN